MTTSPTQATLVGDLSEAVGALEPELIEFRRDLHAHPELSRQETRTTAKVLDRLTEAGVITRTLPGMTGLLADIGAPEPRHRIALRADLDALPVRERTGLPWASTEAAVTHACGHDVHTTAVLGAGLALQGQAERLKEAGLGVRLIFQPAEEVIPGGAHGILDHGGLDGVDTVFAIHCDPTVDVGEVGLREGPITAACDSLTVRLTGHGGHTSRPHLTQDLTFALAKLVTEVPAVLSRRLDPRAGAALVWGVVQAGKASNVIPSSGMAQGTLRILDATVWHEVGPILDEVITQVVAPYGVTAEIERIQGVPPVVNTPEAVKALGIAALGVGITPVTTKQSLGGEDFAWYLGSTPGAMARFGTRTPGGPTYDLHQGDLVIDERAVASAAKLFAAVAVAPLRTPSA